MMRNTPSRYPIICTPYPACHVSFRKFSCGVYVLLTRLFVKTYAD